MGQKFWDEHARKEDLTKLAKEIFGEDVVSEAWTFVGEDGGHWADSEDRKTSLLPVDAYPIYVVFKNGKTFHIWASEWGGVAPGLDGIS